MIKYDVFCDESRHLEHDIFQYMLIGGIWCEQEYRREINTVILEMKNKAEFAGEIKWNKVTPKKIDLFKNIISFFFQTRALSFRCIVIDKKTLKHDIFNKKGGHDEFYYKMYYYMLNKKICPPNSYRIFLDYKGKNDAEKIINLQNIIGHTYYDFSNEIVPLMQSVHSFQHPILQLTDLFIGAVGYEWNDLITSKTKLEICAHIKDLSSNQSLKITTPYRENKFEIFRIFLR
ncbi:MAG: DUF3800 domain-containing protein [Bacteroidales bacterium]|jgi:hypothetical protein|nr:DUF3800 domain-containing protein [Actinomycetota bacterium]MDX9797334.1 DUF3800 domain-containing protein [Bacteroidales bacterium]